MSVRTILITSSISRFHSKYLSEDPNKERWLIDFPMKDYGKIAQWRHWRRLAVTLQIAKKVTLLHRVATQSDVNQDHIPCPKHTHPYCVWVRFVKRWITHPIDFFRFPWCACECECVCILLFRASIRITQFINITYILRHCSIAK